MLLWLCTIHIMHPCFIFQITNLLTISITMFHMLAVWTEDSSTTCTNGWWGRRPLSQVLPLPLLLLLLVVLLYLLCLLPLWPLNLGRTRARLRLESRTFCMYSGIIRRSHRSLLATCVNLSARLQGQTTTSQHGNSFCQATCHWCMTTYATGAWLHLPLVHDYICHWCMTTPATGAWLHLPLVHDYIWPIYLKMSMDVGS